MLHAWAEALAADMVDEDGTAPTLPSFKELEGQTEEADMTTVAQARFAKWSREYRELHMARGVKQGIEQGIERGIEQGIERGIERERRRNVAMMRRLAAIKFGAETAGRLVAILGDHPTEERMEHAGIAIMECNDGDELLARCSEMVP